MKRREALHLLGAGLAAQGAALAGCSGTQTPVEERNERARRATGDVMLGAAWPWDRRKNLLYRNGMQFAVDRVNAAGGVLGRRIQMVFDDDDESVDKGRVVAQRFGNNPDIAAVIGHLQSYVSEPAAAIYDLAGLLMIAPTSTGTALTGHGYRRVFRTIFTDIETGRQMAEFAAKQQYGRLAVYYVRSPYGREVANAFEERAGELGLSVVARQSFDSNVEHTWTSRLEDWRGRDLEAIFIASDGAAAGAFISAIRHMGITAPILGADAMGTSDLFASNAGAVEGTVIASPFHPDEPRQDVRRFVQDFAGRFGVAPDASAALACDAVGVLAHAMTAARTTVPDQVAEALRQIKAWPGVTGPFTFNDRGDLTERSVINVVARNGRLEFLKDGVR